MFVALISDKETELPNSSSFKVLHRRPFVLVMCNNLTERQTYHSHTIPANLHPDLSTPLWEYTNRSFRVVRDISSGCPIYWVSTPIRVLVSDSMHGLRKLGIHLEVLPAFLQEFLTYGYIFPPHTLLRDVKQLFPGQCLSVTWNQTDRFQVTTSNPVDIFLREFGGRQHEKNIPNLIDDVLDQIEIPYDEPGVLLSGGLDSTLIFHCAKKSGPISKAILQVTGLTHVMTRKRSTLRLVLPIIKRITIISNQNLLYSLKMLSRQ